MNNIDEDYLDVVSRELLVLKDKYYSFDYGQKHYAIKLSDAILYLRHDRQNMLPMFIKTEDIKKINDTQLLTLIKDVKAQAKSIVALKQAEFDKLN